MSIFAGVKRLFQHSAVYGIGHILNRLITFALIPLYTGAFNRDLFGVYSMLFSYIVVMTVIYSYGLDTAFFRFYIIEDSEKNRNRIFSTAYISVIVTSILWSAVIILMREPLADLLFKGDVQHLPIDMPLMIIMSAGVLFFDSLMLMPFLIMRAEEKPVQFIIFKFLNVIINFVANVVLIVNLDMGIEGIFIANLISSGLTFLLLLPGSLKHFKFDFHWPTFKDLFAFGIPYLPSTLSVGLMDAADRFILERLTDVGTVGIYSANAKMGMFMALFITAFRFAWHPFFLSTSKQQNAKDIFKKVFTYVLLACSFVFLFFSYFIDEIVRIDLKIGDYTLVDKDYWEGTFIIPILFLAYIFYAAYINFIIGIYLEKKTKYLPFITGAGVLANVAALYALIPVLGYAGAAWARVIGYVVMAVSLYFVGQKLYPVNQEWGRILKMVLLVAFFFFLGRSDFMMPQFWLKMALFVLYPIALLIVGFFQKDELSTVKRLVLRKAAS